MWTVYWWTGDGSHTFRKLGDAIEYVRPYRTRGFTLVWRVFGFRLWMKTFAGVEN